MSLLPATLLLALCLHVSLSLSATIIIPYRDLGEMTHVAEAVVLVRMIDRIERTSGQIFQPVQRLEVIRSVKGPLLPGESWDLPALGVRGPDWVQILPDDVELEEGVAYLLFLSRYRHGWRPLLFTYALFEEVATADRMLLVPLQAGLSVPQMQRPDGVTPEPLLVYDRDLLLDHLEEVVVGAPWDKDAARFSDNPAAFWPYASTRAAPGHCTFLQTLEGIGFRWLDFPNDDLPTHVPAAGDSDCSPPSKANEHTLSAVASMSSSYLGISILGPDEFDNFTPNCDQDGSAYGDSLLNFMNNQLGGPRNLVVQFNDPCDEIAPLSGCGGVLAFGGLYGFSPTYQYDGETYYQGAYGFVVVNKGVCGCISEAGYVILMIHEMTHAIGLGHIDGIYTANMNPTCCNNISSFDIACVDYFYEPAPLPVEWLSFTARTEGAQVRLDWQTATEFNSAWYYVERSVDGQQYSLLDRLPAAGFATQLSSYTYLDRDPGGGQVYYRLKQEDYDGQFSYSKVVTVALPIPTTQVIVTGGPGSLDLIVAKSGDTPVLLTLVDGLGRMCGRVDIRESAGHYSLTWPQAIQHTGVYRMQIVEQTGSYVQTLFLSR